MPSDIPQHEDDPAQAALRGRAREFLAANARRRRAARTGDDDDPASDDALSRLPAEDDDVAAVEKAKAFQQVLFDAGLAGLMAPAAYGGQGLGLTEHLIWNEE